MKKLTLTLLALLVAAVTAGAQNELEIVWQGTGESGGNHYGTGACGGDFNNDGFSDVVIGAWGWHYFGGNGQGKNYLYFGGEDYIDTVDMFFEGDSAIDGFDSDISNVQDVNGDNIEDLLIPGAGFWTGGYVEIFFGGSDIDTIADWRAKKQAIDEREFFGHSTDSTGDVNGDGWNDFVLAGGYYDVQPPYFEIYHGGPDLDTIPDWRYSTLEFVNAYFEVKGLGDINGDGFDDLMAYKSGVGYPGQIFLGGNPMDTIPDFEIQTSVSDGSGVGDVNDDGYADWAVRRDLPGDSSDTVVYFGSVDFDTTADVVLYGWFSENVHAGRSITHADVNGDGIQDIIRPADWLTIVLYLGSPWFNGVPDWHYNDSHMLDGYSINAVGDVNDDGCDEFVLGMPNYDSSTWSNIGEAILFAGNPDLVDLGAPVEPSDLIYSPGRYKLYQNYPNPFNNSTTIRFELGVIATVSVSIYDLKGQLVRRLISQQDMLPGGYNVSWTGLNQQGVNVASGMYLIELRVDPRGGGKFREIKKMILIR